jgi:hypothetical protein
LFEWLQADMISNAVIINKHFFGSSINRSMNCLAIYELLRPVGRN